MNSSNTVSFSLISIVIQHVSHKGADPRYSVQHLDLTGAAEVRCSSPIYPLTKRTRIRGLEHPESSVEKEEQAQEPSPPFTGRANTLSNGRM